ncbi:MAG: NAD(+)/NADH kinase [Oscillospiraceae bacterium]|nr:NAD(+)/NADH kinase [Oscillospiraceae bacterium]
MRIALCPNPYKDRGLRAAQSAQKILQSNGVETVLCLPFELGGKGKNVLPDGLDYKKVEQALPGSDMLICFGGDGTILQTARYANEYDLPILGINLGSVGFLAELEHSEMSLLSKLATGNYRIEERMMLDVSVVRRNHRIFHDTALNDAALLKNALGHVMGIKLKCDDLEMENFKGDGVVVSTPTGSTGYTISAGGPIVEPEAENIIVTPICPQTAIAKPMVLSGKRTVSLQAEKGSQRAAYLSVDGRKNFRFTNGDTAVFKKSDCVTRLVRLSDRTYFDILNQKIGRS